MRWANSPSCHPCPIHLTFSPSGFSFLFFFSPSVSHFHFSFLGCRLTTKLPICPFCVCAWSWDQIIIWMPLNSVPLKSEMAQCSTASDLRYRWCCVLWYYPPNSECFHLVSYGALGLRPASPPSSPMFCTVQ